MSNKLIQSIEDDSTVLQEFPHLHQRRKFATFCTSTRPADFKSSTYLMWSAETSISRPFLKQFNFSVDSFWADTLKSPIDFEGNHGDVYQKALDQVQLGIRDGGCGCPRNEPFLDAAQYRALAETTIWFKEHGIHFPRLLRSIIEI